MSLFRSPKERRLWIAAALYTLLIYSTLSVVRPMIEAVRSGGFLRLLVGAVFGAAALAVVVAMVRLKIGRRGWWVLAGGALVYALLLPFFHEPEEMIHLIQYGVLGVLLYGALDARRRSTPAPRSLALRFPALAAVLLTTLLGWVDEGIQYLLPSRVYDLRDVAFNAIAAAVAVAVASAFTRARETASKATGDGFRGEAPAD